MHAPHAFGEASAEAGGGREAAVGLNARGKERLPLQQGAPINLELNEALRWDASHHTTPKLLRHCVEEESEKRQESEREETAAGKLASPPSPAQARCAHRSAHL